jgi:transcriptional regulator with XRE-family HTH domain
LQGGVDCRKDCSITLRIVFTLRGAHIIMNKHEDLRIGHIIKILRVALGLSQKDLAKRVGIQPHHLSLVEGGKRHSSLAVLREIARQFDVPVSLLFWEAEQRPELITTEQQQRWYSLRSLLVEMERRRLREKDEQQASNEVA